MGIEGKDSSRISLEGNGNTTEGVIGKMCSEGGQSVNFLEQRGLS